MPQRDGTRTQRQRPRRGRGLGLFRTDREGIKKSDDNAGLFGRLRIFFEPDQRGTGGGQGRGKDRWRGRGRNR